MAAVAPPQTRVRGRLPVGWPLTATLIGYPLWWVLGIAGILPLFAGVVMAVQLVRGEHRIHVRRGFGCWLLFLVWVALGVVLLQVSAPSALIDHSYTRYITFAFRFAWYATATIAMIYIYNLRDQLSTTRVLRAFGWLFITVVCGGIIGTLAPAIDFPSLLQLALPHHYVNVQYIHDLIHPVISQRYTVDGVVNPRASAPFAYTNDWGLNYACLLPFFVQSWVRDAGPRRRRVGIVILVASVYPLIETQNRGAWLAIVVMALVVAFRSAMFGRMKTVALLAAVGAIVGVVMVTTPIGSQITNRLEHGYSNAGRAYLGTLTVDSVMSRSPVVGLGSTRNVEGSIYSIAGGNSAACSLCTPPALGTQGHFWLLIFSTGAGGVCLYLGFVALNLIRSARRNSPLATIALAVLTTHLVTMFVYDAIGIELVTIFGAIGLLWRDLAGSNAPVNDYGSVDAGDRFLGDYSGSVRTYRTALIFLAILGAVGGGVLYRRQPSRVVMETDVAAPPNALLPGGAQFAQSLDTIAGLIDSPSVLRAVASASGGSPDQVRSRLTVAADPNTRILLIRFADSSAAAAARGSRAAAAALIAHRHQLLAASRAQSLASLAEQRAGLLRATRTLGDVHQPTLALVNDLADLGAVQARVRASSTAGGSIVVPPHRYRTRGDRLVYVMNGVAVGLLLTVAFATARGRRKRYAAVAALSNATDLSVLDRIDLYTGAPMNRKQLAQRLDRTATGLFATRTTCIVPVDEHTDWVARSLQLRLKARRRAAHDGVALIASDRTPYKRVIAARHRLARLGVPVTGIVLTDSDSKINQNKTAAMQRLDSFGGR